MLKAARVNPPPNPATLSSQPVINVQHVNKRFGDEIAVQDLTFTVQPSTIFGFIGPSGSGKTTTVRLLTGFFVPTDGVVTILGSFPARFSQRQRARIGYMPQFFVLYPNLTVWENLNFAASIYGVSLFRRKRLQEILEFVELYEYRDKRARDISGGMQRRLSLAAALVHNPDLIFLDEPTAGIDPVLRQKFWEHFKKLQSEGHTLFITTQYVNEAEHCDQLGVMSNGRLLTVDTPEGLRRAAYGGEIIDVSMTAPIEYQTEHLIDTICRKTVRTGPNSLRLIVDQASAIIPEVIAWAQQNNMQVERLEQFRPPFEDVFVELVKKSNGD